MREKDDRAKPRYERGTTEAEKVRAYARLRVYVRCWSVGVGGSRLWVLLADIDLLLLHLVLVNGPLRAPD